MNRGISPVLFLMVLTPAAQAADCSGFAGAYERDCKVAEGRLNHPLDRELGREKGIVVIKADKECRGLYFNDPDWNAVFEPIYLTGGDFESGYTSVVHRRNSPVISENRISASYKIIHRDSSPAMRSREKVEFSIEKSGASTVKTHYLEQHISIFGMSTFESDCTLTRRQR